MGTAGMDGLLMRPADGGAAGAEVTAGTRGIVGTRSRPVSMLISPYSSSSIAAVGSDAAAAGCVARPDARPAAGGPTRRACEPCR